LDSRFEKRDAKGIGEGDEEAAIDDDVIRGNVRRFGGVPAREAMRGPAGGIGRAPEFDGVVGHAGREEKRGHLDSFCHVELAHIGRERL
jgi:hypothetical protein